MDEGWSTEAGIMSDHEDGDGDETIDELYKEIFNVEELKQAQDAFALLPTVEDNEESDDDEVVHERGKHRHHSKGKLRCIPRICLFGVAKKVKPAKKMDDCLCAGLASGMQTNDLDELPILSQYVIPLMIGGVDTFVISARHSYNCTAFMLPILQSAVGATREEGTRLDRRPFGAILSKNHGYRVKMLTALNNLAGDGLSNRLKFALATKRTELYTTLEANNQKIDILICSPSSFVNFFQKMVGHDDSVLHADHLEYVVITEVSDIVEDVREFGPDDGHNFFRPFSEMLKKMRMKKAFTIVALTRGTKPDKCLAVTNIMKKEKAVIALDSGIAMEHIVHAMYGSMEKRKKLMLLLMHRKETNRKSGRSGLYYKKLTLVFVPSVAEMHMLILFLRSFPGFDEHEIVNIDENKAAFEDIKRGNVLVAFSAHPHGTRIKNAIVDMVIFYDLFSNMNEVVLNVGKIALERRCVYFIKPSLFDQLESDEERRRMAERVVSFVHYLRQHAARIPEELRAVFNTSLTILGSRPIVEVSNSVFEH